MNDKPCIFGLVLAGGRSSRFGREKAAALLEGRPLIDWVAGVLGPATLELAISANPESGAAAYAADRGLPCLVDSDAGGLAGGPLAGVLQGLRWAASQAGVKDREVWLATAPCDTPLLPTHLVALLAAGRSAGGAVARTIEGLQPLCALWPRSALERLAGMDRHPPIREVLKMLGAAEVEFTDAKAFTNMNHPESLARVEAARL